MTIVHRLAVGRQKDITEDAEDSDEHACKGSLGALCKEQARRRRSTSTSSVRILAATPIPLANVRFERRIDLADAVYWLG